MVLVFGYKDTIMNWSKYLIVCCVTSAMSISGALAQMMTGDSRFSVSKTTAAPERNFRSQFTDFHFFGEVAPNVIEASEFHFYEEPTAFLKTKLVIDIHPIAPSDWIKLSGYRSFWTVMSTFRKVEQLELEIETAASPFQPSIDNPIQASIDGPLVAVGRFAIIAENFPKITANLSDLSELPLQMVRLMQFDIQLIGRVVGEKTERSDGVFLLDTFSIRWAYLPQRSDEHSRTFAIDGASRSGVWVDSNN